MAKITNSDKNKGKGLIGGRGVTGTITRANYGGVLTKNRPTSMAGGLGMPGYGNPAKTPNLRTPRNATTATRNYQYGEVTAKPAPKVAVIPKAVAKVTPTTATEITIPGGGLKTAKATPAASKAPSSRGGLGVSSGKTTGSSTTRAGTGGRTGGRGNAGPAGMGASGRGTGGKR